MGRKKWKLYQDAILAEGGGEQTGASSDENERDAPEEPAIKIKTIEQINTAPDGENNAQEAPAKTQTPPRTETILESLIKRPATQPRVIAEDEWRPACTAHQSRVKREPQDWKPAERCHFCDEEPGAGGGEVGGAPREGGAASPAASESSGSSVSSRSPAAAPPALLAHLLQLQQNPQAIAQFQQMMAALAALGGGLMPQAALSQALILQRLQQSQQRHVDRLTTDMGEKVSVSNSSPSFPGPTPSPGAADITPGNGGTEQPLDLSARSNSACDQDRLQSRVPPIDHKLRLKRPASATECLSAMNSGMRRAYTDDELQNALRDIQSGRLGTRRAAVLYGIPRSTLRNKAEREPSQLQQMMEEDPSGVILKIPRFPVPEREPTPPRLPDVPFPQLPFSAPPAPGGETLFSLRDVIAKSISQKAPGDERHVSVIKHLAEPPRPHNLPYPINHHHQHNQHGQHPNSRQPSNNGNAAGGKGTRPKRGKYRNYDRDSLVEAVKAVQRGEMSVHRAGSYYGVPHSTLEYKVKERHLMRPRKREPKPPPDPPKPQPPKPQVPPKPMSKSFNGVNGPDYPQPAYPFWPPFAGGDFASHMMQRLRDEAPQPPPPPANGSFLEGIIRSSLERPGALLQRLTADPAPTNATPSVNNANASLLQRLTETTDKTFPTQDKFQSPTPRPDDVKPFAHLTKAPEDAKPFAQETDPEGSPPARRQRLSSCDRQLAEEMRETIQRLRARNATPPPPMHPQLHTTTDRA